MQLPPTARSIRRCYVLFGSVLRSCQEILGSGYPDTQSGKAPENNRKWQGIGCDVEEIGRFTVDREKDARFLARIYTAGEIEYSFSCPNPALHLAVRFCAKEAAVKAFCSIGEDLIDYAKIEITNQDSGVPDLIIHGSEGVLLHNTYDLSISLSHSQSTAMAVVIITRKQIGRQFLDNHDSY